MPRVCQLSLNRSAQEVFAKAQLTPVNLIEAIFILGLLGPFLVPNWYLLAHGVPFLPVLGPSDYFTYSWIAPPIRTREIITQQTERATTNPRPRAESSWQGESRFAGSIFG